MNQIVDFYLDEGTATDGYTLEQIWDWNDDDYELEKNYVQWLFPTPRESDFNPDAPVLTGQDVSAFLSDSLLRHRLRQSFVRFLRFLGLSLVGDAVVEGENFWRRRQEVWSRFNHNWLRVSRVLSSLTLLGLGAEAKAFFIWLDTAFHQGYIGDGDGSQQREAHESHTIWANIIGPRQEVSGQPS